MAWMNQSRKAKIVEAAKPILAKYGVKATFKCSQHSINCTLKSGPIDFVAEMADTEHGRPIDKDKLRKNYSFTINQYWYEEHYKDGKAKDFIEEICGALRAGDWYDRSDIQSDYFDTAYYYNLHVGTWVKPYTVTK